MTRPSTANAAWQTLMEGNRNFVAGTPARPRQEIEIRRAVANQQLPFAALFGCSDSRLAAEMIFDVGLGDLFVVRNAGQVIAETIIGSLEFAVEVLGVPLILVLAHDECGAVKSSIAAQRGELELNGEFIHNLVNRITPTVTKSLAAGRSDLEQITADHVAETIAELLDRSKVISEAVEAGKLAVVGANYRLALGEVQRLVVHGSID